MKIITEPTVTVVGVTQFFPHPKYKLPVDKDKSVTQYKVMGEKGAEVFDQRHNLQGTPLEQITAMAGKGCYDSYGEDGRNINDHIQSLINSRHGSVLEHGNISLFIEGISRGCSHEIVRHRAGFAYSQRSTRYVDEGDCAIVLDPFYAKQYEDKHMSAEHFIETCKNSIDVYNGTVDWLLEAAPVELHPKDKRKWARGKARQLLPHAIETRMTMTGNLRAWRHFIEQRSNRFAEAEIRRLAEKVFVTIKDLAPTVFADYEGEVVDGYYEFITPNTKV